MRRILSAAAMAALVLAACRGTDSPVGTSLVQPDLGGAQQASTKYIVVYNNQVTDTRAEINRHVSVMASKVERVYQYSIRGWSGDLTPAEVAQLRADPDVAFVEQDGPAHISAPQSPTPSWGLDRIDQVSLPLNNSYTFNGTGAGVHFYGIDTGILYTHVDFGGRASKGFDAVTAGGTAIDCNGHGSHTASTAAGSTYGVAKGMTLIAVRVLDCTGFGTISGVVAGVDWVTQHAIKPAVANMSLGAGLSPALDASVAASIASGVVYAIASGNGDIFGNPLDACNGSPADVLTAITVNASTISDARASFSNYGPCTDIYAPGVGITGAWLGTTANPNNNSNTISGTSMATPHVAGVVGLYLEANPTATPAQVAAALVANASPNKITNPLPNTPNKLLNMGFISGGTPNQPPVAHFNYSCPTLQCTFDASPSTDDAGIVSYAWTWGNGKSETHSSPNAKNTFAAGIYNITLKVTDGGGLSNSITIALTVPTPPANLPPTATITQPANNASFVQGTSVAFAGSGNDPETGALTGSALVWTSDIDGQIGTGTSFSTTTLSVGAHVITLTSTDPQNAHGTATRNITIAAPVNQPPVAAFSYVCNTVPHQCSFNAGTSTDDHGIVSYQWNWGNGRTETKVGPSTKNTWAVTGTYNVTLTVTDAGGLSSSLVVAVAVP